MRFKDDYIEKIVNKRKKRHILSEQEKQEIIDGYIYYKLKALPIDKYDKKKLRIFWYTCTKLDLNTECAYITENEVKELFPEYDREAAMSMIWDMQITVRYRYENGIGSRIMISSIMYCEDGRYEIRFAPIEKPLLNFIAEHQLEDFY